MPFRGSYCSTQNTICPSPHGRANRRHIVAMRGRLDAWPPRSSTRPRAAPRTALGLAIRRRVTGKGLPLVCARLGPLSNWASHPKSDKRHCPSWRTHLPKRGPTPALRRGVNRTRRDCDAPAAAREHHPHEQHRIGMKRSGGSSQISAAVSTLINIAGHQVIRRTCCRSRASRSRVAAIPGGMRTPVKPLGRNDFRDRRLIPCPTKYPIIVLGKPDRASRRRSRPRR